MQHKLDKTSIAKALKAERVLQGKTIYRCAKETGINKISIQQIEDPEAKANYTINNLLAYADYLGVQIKYETRDWSTPVDQVGLEPNGNAKRLGDYKSAPQIQQLNVLEGLAILANSSLNTEAFVLKDDGSLTVECSDKGITLSFDHEGLLICHESGMHYPQYVDVAVYQMTKLFNN